MFIACTGLTKPHITWFRKGIIYRLPSTQLRASIVALLVWLFLFPALVVAQAPVRYVSVAAGAQASFAIDANGQLWAWGLNAYGQLGDGTMRGQVNPIPIPAPASAAPGTTWTRIKVGGRFTVGLRSDHTLWTWGIHGELGDNSPSDDGYRGRPEQIIAVGADPASHWTEVATGGGHTLALRSDGSLWAWGWNNTGQLGLGNQTPEKLLVPVLVPTPAGASPGSRWRHIAAADGVSFGIRSDGTLWSWGYSREPNNALGHAGCLAGCFTPQEVLAPVGASPGSTWVEVVSGGAHTLALRSDGTLWSWGHNYYGALGVNTRISGTSTPVLVPLPAGAGGATWQQIQAGTEFSHAILTDGTLWGWGLNDGGQLGVNLSNTFEPTPVQEYTLGTWTQVADGYGHALALSKGQVHVTGTGANGVLGLGNTASRIPFFVRIVRLPLASAQLANVTLSIYPNPVGSGGRLTLQGLPASCQAELHTLHGQRISTAPLTSSSLLLPELPVGIYWLRVLQDGKEVGRQRISIQ